MTQEELQKYWDACLIRQWRQFGKIYDLFSMYKSIVGSYPQTGSLLRMPPEGLPHRIGVRVYVDNFLSKLNEKLWATSPEKDVDTLRALTKSKYNNKQRKATDGERARNAERKRSKRADLRVEFNYKSFEKRNQATDWGVVKSSKARVRRMRK